MLGDQRIADNARNSTKEFVQLDSDTFTRYTDNFVAVLRTAKQDWNARQFVLSVRARKETMPREICKIVFNPDIGTYIDAGIKFNKSAVYLTDTYVFRDMKSVLDYAMMRLNIEEYW